MKKPLDFPYLTLLVDNKELSLIFSYGVADHRYIRYSTDYGLGDIFSNMERAIRHLLNKYRTECSVIADNINNPRNSRVRLRCTDDFFHNLLKQNTDAVDFVNRISEVGVPEMIETEIKGSWTNLRKYGKIWESRIAQARSLSDVCSITKNFTIALYNNICMHIQDALESLNSNTTPYGGILITGDCISKQLYNKLKPQYYITSHMPILTEKYPESLVNAWGALEMLKAGYNGRSNVGNLTLLSSMPVGPPKRLPIKQINLRHTKLSL